ncbi:MAG: RNA 2',3'-cyclic phosphodiesterase [Waddliaceae bacterium]
MSSLLIAIYLPEEVREHLKRLCYGLPGINWEEEENFILPLHDIGQTDGAMLLDIRERLSAVYFPMFTLSFEEVGHSPKKKSGGVLWAGVKASTPLLQIKNEIQKSLKTLSVSSQLRPSHPRVVLGRYHRVSPNRIASYLESHSYFYCPAFLVDEFFLLSGRMTKKRSFYIEEDRYPLIG